MPLQRRTTAPTALAAPTAPTAPTAPAAPTAHVASFGQSIKDGIGLGIGSGIGHSIARWMGFGSSPASNSTTAAATTATTTAATVPAPSVADNASPRDRGIVSLDTISLPLEGVIEAGEYTIRQPLASPLFSRDYVQCLVNMKGDESACEHIRLLEKEQKIE